VLVTSHLTAFLVLRVADKVKKKYGSLGHSVLTVQLERGRQGLGLSLAGHKDRSRMAVFVCGLNPNGAASRTGGIQVGDEILEVMSDCLFSFLIGVLACISFYWRVDSSQQWLLSGLGN
jgi:hypothetical protein